MFIFIIKVEKLHAVIEATININAVMVLSLLDRAKITKIPNDRIKDTIGIPQ
jgi:uncharacterized membrane protein